MLSTGAAIMAYGFTFPHWNPGAFIYFVGITLTIFALLSKEGSAK